MKSLLLFWVVGLYSFPAFSQVISSKVYSYDQLPIVNYIGYQERTLLEGSTRDFSHLILQAITLLANQPDQPTQQLDEESVLIIKEGVVTLTIGSKHKTLGPGSVVVIMPGDDYKVENKAAQPLTYYLMRYTSNEMPDLDLYQLMGGSFWIDWQEIAATTDHPGRRVTFSTVMSSRIAVQATTLAPGLGSQASHTHRAAEILISLNHPIQAHIEGVQKKAQMGDLIFVESEVPHGIQNDSQEGSSFLSIQF